MSLTQLKHQLGPARFSLVLMLVMSVMVLFGYQLARYHWHSNHKELVNARQTAEMLMTENASLRSRVAQLEVDAELSRRTLQSLRDELASANHARRQLDDQLAFYQRVMAPETTQEGFEVDGLQVNPTASPGYYRASFVLLQQRENKAVVKGNLNLRLMGSQDGEPKTLRSGSSEFLPEGAIKYRFKYFQTVEIQFQLPDGFTPEYLEFFTEVYQYTTKRGDYRRRVAWQEIFEPPVDSEDTSSAN